MSEKDGIKFFRSAIANGVLLDPCLSFPAFSDRVLGHVSRISKHTFCFLKGRHYYIGWYFGHFGEMVSDFPPENRSEFLFSLHTMPASGLWTLALKLIKWSLKLFLCTTRPVTFLYKDFQTANGGKITKKSNYYR